MESSSVYPSEENPKQRMVEIVESGFVVPSEETPKDSIWLSNMDILRRHTYTPAVYLYRPNGDADFFSVEVLKAAMAKALVPFYPLAGRLNVSQDGRLEIQCTGEGVLFVVARSHSTMDEFGDFSPSPEIRQLMVPPADPNKLPAILFMFQVTFFKCGGVCLGTCLHHSATDGPGAVHFISTWSGTARGIELTEAPWLDRTPLRARSPPTVTFDHRLEYQSKFKDQTPAAAVMFKLSKYQVTSLKSKSGSGARFFSTFQAVMAHVWRCACKAREIEGHQETQLFMAVDVRARLEPPLPPRYFGNPSVRASTVAAAGEIMSEPLSFTADRINEAVARCNDQFIRSVIDMLELQQSNLSEMSKGINWCSANNLYVVSWQRMPVYDADFGWGKPVFMGPAMLASRGFVYIMHSPDGGGEVELMVALEPENIPRFTNLFYEDLDVL